MAISDLTAGLAEYDRLYGNDGSKPVVNLLSLAHSGTRAAESYLQAQGKFVRRFHLQMHYHTKEFCEQLLQDAGNKTIVLVRDPLMVILSTMNRDDDLQESVFRNVADFYRLKWQQANKVIPIELTPAITVKEALVYKDKVFYSQRNLAAIQTKRKGLAAKIAQLETLARPKLEALGYTNLPWWS